MALRIFILGGGRFGTHLGSRLSEFGCEVVIADNNTKRVEDLSEEGFHVVELDADDQVALKAAGVQEADAVVISIGENMQASILAALLLKELNVRNLIARAVDVKHAQVLEKLGADLVVLPSRDMANQLAESLRAGLHSSRLPINGEYQLANVRLGSKLHGRTLADAQLPLKYGITISLIRRPTVRAELAAKELESAENVEPSPTFELHANDWLVVTGRRENIDAFERDCGTKGK
jgi:trk system potassium uptake protein TrkA